MSVAISSAQKLGDKAKALFMQPLMDIFAIIAVADPIKKNNPEAIKALHDLGLRVAMITGDNRSHSKAIVKQLGIDEIAAEVLPDGKVEALKQFAIKAPKSLFLLVMVSMMLSACTLMLG